MDADLIEIDDANEEQPLNETKMREVHKRAMRRFDACSQPTMEMRAESLLARRFVAIPGSQWEGDWGEAFDKSIKVQVNKTGRGLDKIMGDYRENRIIPDFRPDGPTADQDTADMLDGLHRADSYRFKSQQARDNAAYEAFSGGFGAYRATNEWEDEADKDNDHQRINPAAIIVDADQSVFFDLNARLYDKSDARFAFIRTALTKDAFCEEYGDDRQTGFPEGTTWKTRDWFRPELIGVAEYYEREDVNDTLWILTHALSGEEKRLWASELEDGALASLVKDGWTKRSQRRKRNRVHKYVLSGAEVLQDCGLIAGECIPIVPVYGQRVFVDGIERWKGYVQDKMDPQRLYNSNVSRLAEINALSPRETPIFLSEQMPPELAQEWARANIDRLPFLRIEAVRDNDGNVVANGPIGYVKPPDAPPVTAALLQIANQDLMEDMADGADTVKANVSAEAMDVAATRVDAKSGVYLDNFRQSVQREGEIYLSMARVVYSEEGREVDTMSEDGDDGRETLGALKTDPKTGANKISNDLQTGKYKVIASVTEATATRRDKTVRSMLNLTEMAVAAQDLEMAQAAMLTAVLNMDGEGLTDFGKYARKKALAIQLVEPNEEEQKAMEQASQQPPAPDPMADLATAQAQDFMASAAKKIAETQKVGVDAKLSEAKTIATLVDAHATHNPPAAEPAPMPKAIHGGPINMVRAA